MSKSPPVVIPLVARTSASLGPTPLTYCTGVVSSSIEIPKHTPRARVNLVRLLPWGREAAHKNSLKGVYPGRRCSVFPDTTIRGRAPTWRPRPSRIPEAEAWKLAGYGELAALAPRPGNSIH